MINPAAGNDDPTAYTLRAGKLFLNGKEAAGTSISAVPNGEKGKLWLFRFDKAL